MSNKQKAIIGFLGVIVSVFMFSLDYVNAKKDKAFETISYAVLVSHKFSENTEVSEVEVTVEEQVETPVETPTVTVSTTPAQTAPTYNYIGMLEIPKIGFKRGFVDADSSANNVDKNIAIIKPSSYPDVEKGNFIIAGHSGTSRVAYFKDLYQLNINDQTYVYYKNIKYTYNIVDIYTQPKIGRLGIYRDPSKTTLTLITCTKDDKTTQTVYIAELISKENY